MVARLSVVILRRAMLEKRSPHWASKERVELPITIAGHHSLISGLQCPGLSVKWENFGTRRLKRLRAAAQ